MKSNLTSFWLIAAVLFSVSSCGKKTADATGKIKITDGALIASTNKLWKNGQTLNVTFLDGSDETKAMVEKIANEWTVYANINFKFFNTVNDIPWYKKADIIISFNKKGNNSSVGTDSLYNVSTGQNSMSLSEMGKSYNINRSIVLHEFGHAIGLEHEHQHMDRTFKLDEAKALEYCRNDIKFTDEMCKANIFQTFSGKDIYLSTYDPFSIMHYTLHPKILQEDVGLRYNHSLSLLDKLEIGKLYPGRLAQSEIIARHMSLIDEVIDTNIYKNCQIVSSTSEVKRLNGFGVVEEMKVSTYSFSSIQDGDFKHEYYWEDKEGVIAMAKNEPYCNLDEIGLIDYRSNTKEQRAQKGTFGNCKIPLNDDGSPRGHLCPTGYKFRVFDKEEKVSIDNACHPTFESAYQTMKTLPFCSLSESELVDLAEKKKVEDEAKKDFGKCFVENKFQLKTALASDIRCRKETPFIIISKQKRESVNSLCYEDANSAINDMKHELVCKP